MHIYHIQGKPATEKRLGEGTLEKLLAWGQQVQAMKKIVLFLSVVVAFTLIDWLVMQNGWHSILKQAFNTGAPVYHFVGWVSCGIFLIWLHKNAFTRIEDRCSHKRRIRVLWQALR